MLFSKISLFTFLAAVAASPALCLVDAAQAVAGIDLFTSNLKEAHQALDSYGDGKVTGFSVAKKVDGAHRAAKRANQSLREAGPLSDEDARKIVASYTQLQPEALGVLRTVSEKAPAMKGQLGVGYIAHGIVSTFYDDKNQLHDTLRKNLPDGQRQALDPQMVTVDSAFQDTMRTVGQ